MVIEENFMTIEKFRERVNNIKTTGDLVEILQVYNCREPYTMSKYSSSVININGFVIGWNIVDETLYFYITKRGELLLYNDNTYLTEESINFILDDVLLLNTPDQFYRLYFKAYGYEVPNHVSNEVKEAFKYFKDKTALINSIYVNGDYSSVTITGRKKVNQNEIEYRIVNCTKQDILDIVSISHVQPVVNKIRNVEFYDTPRGFRPPISNQDIMDSYNDYKDSLAYD